jgi:hypothetical protein
LLRFAPRMTMMHGTWRSNRRGSCKGLAAIGPTYHGRCAIVLIRRMVERSLASIWGYGVRP